MIFDMIVQVLDSSKNTIAWSGKFFVSNWSHTRRRGSYPVTSSFHLHIATSSRSFEALSWRALVLMAGEALAVIGWLVEENCADEKL
jgi:hypothetical protein